VRRHRRGQAARYEHFVNIEFQKSDNSVKSRIRED